MNDINGIIDMLFTNQLGDTKLQSKPCVHKLNETNFYQVILSNTKL